MEKFFSLPKEKQKRIIEAGLHCFGKMGYKKASAQDIAQEAGISKSLVFHYFGSKKGMYQYLIKISSEEITQAFTAGFDTRVTDFFDRILMLTSCKLRCLQKHPSLLSFFTSLYTETDPEVAEEVQAVMAQGKQIRMNAALTNSGLEKFKDPSYADLTQKLLMGYGESYVNSARTLELDSLMEAMKEFTNCIHMLKQNLYKNEYLEESFCPLRRNDYD